MKDQTYPTDTTPGQFSGKAVEVAKAAASEPTFECDHGPSSGGAYAGSKKKGKPMQTSGY
ncbi:MAG: hypothetical protein ACREQA_16000 [Candidatus Binatia bacterium]